MKGVFPLQTPSLRENPMGSRKILPLLLSMSVPPMISMMIQGLYNIVDSIFVAHLSQEALTAVSLVYPLQNLTLSVAVGLGVGLNACIARSLDLAPSSWRVTFISGALFALVRQWVLSGCKETPEQMAQLTVELLQTVA